MRLSVVIPAFREAEAIARTIERVRSALEPQLDGGGLEIIVVDDGSDDGTAESAHGADRVIAFPHNRGKGAAVRAGARAAVGSIVAFTDADLSYPPAQIIGLLREVEDGADLVAGSRHHPATTTVVEASRLRRIGGRVINAATRLVLSQARSDTQCGLKALSQDTVGQILTPGRIDGFAFDVELFALAERRGLTIVEVPVEVANTEHSTVRVVRDAIRLLSDIARIRWYLWRDLYDLA